MNRLLILFFFILMGCSKTPIPIIIEQDYSFLRIDGNVSKLIQSNDTLFEKSFYEDTLNYESRNKILSTVALEDFTILKLENIDEIPVSQNLCPGKKYSIMALKKNNNMQLVFHYLDGCFNRTELDNYQINLSKLKDRDDLVYLSDSYLEELSTKKTISTIGDISKILNTIENNDFNSGDIAYSANELNKACIKLGYNPVGAAITIDSLMRH